MDGGFLAHIFMTKKFTINIECSVDMDLDELWPDGDAPENPTAKDVENLIEKSGGPVGIIDDWNLRDDFLLFVYPIKEQPTFQLSFIECPECASKPGSPTLCDDCLARRAVFYKQGK